MDNEPLSKSDFLIHIELVREDVKATHERLDTLNDRTRKVEQAIAVLEDRGHPAAWGGGIGGLMVGVVEGVRWMLGR